jgi:amino acid permease
LTSEASDFISREELQAGLPARRASTLLFAIESRTAQLVARANKATAIYLTPKALEEQEQNFLSAIAAGRELPVQPRIQDLDRYAKHWANLIPEDPRLQAAIAHLLAQKYRFTAQRVVSLRSALGLDSPDIQEAYQRLYQQPLETIYVPILTPRDRIRWLWKSFSTKLESLPPFWITLLLTIPGVVGLLALPIALAGVGFTTAITLIIIFGVINMLTVWALAEAVTRSGTTRFGLGFLGQLVDEYLGRASSTMLTVIMSLNNFFILIIFFLGVAGTLEDSTSLPTELWVIGLFGVCLYFLFRRSFNSTVGTTILIVLVNLVILLLIPLLALPNFSSANLPSFNFPFQGETFNPATWGLVLGVMLSTFFSHILIAAYAPVTLRRESGGRSWIWGSVAAIFVLMLIACAWMVVINGTIPAEILASTTGTVLSPLAEVAGQSVIWLGSLLVVLSLGLGCIQVALVLYYLVDERLPAQPSNGIFRRFSDRGRFWLAISPVILAFLLTELIALTGRGSFTSFLGIIGALSLPMLGGMIPVLLLAATRRKGDFEPGLVSRLVGNPILLTAIYLFFLATIFTHGLFIWEDPLPRILAIGIGIWVLGVTVRMLLRGTMKKRISIELREDQRLEGNNILQIVSGGQQFAVEAQLKTLDREENVQGEFVQLPDFEQVNSISLQVEPDEARTVKIWAHRLTAEGSSQGLPVSIEITSGNESQRFDLGETGEKISFPIMGETQQIYFSFSRE